MFVNGRSIPIQQNYREVHFNETIPNDGKVIELLAYDYLGRRTTAVISPQYPPTKLLACSSNLAMEGNNYLVSNGQTHAADTNPPNIEISLWVTNENKRKSLNEVDIVDVYLNKLSVFMKVDDESGIEKIETSLPVRVKKNGKSAIIHKAVTEYLPNSVSTNLSYELDWPTIPERTLLAKIQIDDVYGNKAVRTFNIKRESIQMNYEYLIDIKDDRETLKTVRVRKNIYEAFDLKNRYGVFIFPFFVEKAEYEIYSKTLLNQLRANLSFTEHTGQLRFQIVDEPPENVPIPKDIRRNKKIHNIPIINSNKYDQVKAALAYARGIPAFRDNEYSKNVRLVIVGEIRKWEGDDDEIGIEVIAKIGDTKAENRIDFGPEDSEYPGLQGISYIIDFITICFMV